MAPRLTPDLCVIGAGSGGLSVAAAAAGFGVPVVLVERHRMGGDCLNTGCVPSKALLAAAKRAQAIRTAGTFGIAAGEPTVDFRAVMAHVRAVQAAIAPNDSEERFTALGVTVIRASARFVSADVVAAGDVEIAARRFVIATGSVAGAAADRGARRHAASDHRHDLGSRRAAAPSRHHRRRAGGLRAGAGVLPPGLGGDGAGGGAPARRARGGLRRGGDRGAAARGRGGAKPGRLSPRCAARRTAWRSRSRKLAGASRSRPRTSSSPPAAGRMSRASGSSRRASLLRRAALRWMPACAPPTAGSMPSATSSAAPCSPTPPAGRPDWWCAAPCSACRWRSIRTSFPASPSPIRSSPQVGLDEAAARSRHRDVRVVRVPFSDNDRAQAERDTAGFLKVVMTRAWPHSRRGDRRPRCRRDDRRVVARGGAAGEHPHLRRAHCALSDARRKSAGGRPLPSSRRV